MSPPTISITTNSRITIEIKIPINDSIRTLPVQGKKLLFAFTIAALRTEAAIKRGAKWHGIAFVAPRAKGHYSWVKTLADLATSRGKGAGRPQWVVDIGDSLFVGSVSPSKTTLLVRPSNAWRDSSPILIKIDGQVKLGTNQLEELALKVESVYSSGNRGWQSECEMRIEDTSPISAQPRNNEVPLSTILGCSDKVECSLKTLEKLGVNTLFAVGDCVEMLRCPTPSTGWEHSQMQFSVRKSILGTSLLFVRMYKRWKQRNRNNKDDPRYALLNVKGKNAIDDPFLNFELQRTSFGRVFSVSDYWRRRKSAAETRISCLQSDLSFSKIPNFVVLHVIVRTKDEKVILAQRAASSHYHPLRWSASFEEQLETQDTVRQNPLVAAVRRGLKEEIGADQIEEVRLLSVFLEHEFLFPTVCSVACIKLSADEAIVRWKEVARDKREARTVSAIPGDFDTITHSLFSKSLMVGAESIPETAWHPTTKYRLFEYALSEYGIQRVSERLRKLYNNPIHQPDRVANCSHSTEVCAGTDA